MFKSDNFTLKYAVTIFRYSFCAGIIQVTKNNSLSGAGANISTALARRCHRTRESLIEKRKKVMEKAATAQRYVAIFLTATHFAVPLSHAVNKSFS